MHQPAARVHGQYDESSFGFSGLIEFGKMRSRPKRRLEFPLLHIAAFLQFLHRSIVCKMSIRIDEKRSERNPGRDGRTTCCHAQILYVNLFDVFPRHDARQLHPVVVLTQPAANWLEKFFYAQLLPILLVIHSLLPPYSPIFPENTRFCLPLLYHTFELFDRFFSAFALSCL